MHNLVKKLYNIGLPLLLAGCVAGTTPVAYQPTLTTERERPTEVIRPPEMPAQVEVTPLPVYTPTPIRPRIAEFMDEVRRYRTLFEGALELQHYTDDILNFDDVASSYVCLRESDDWDQPSGNWDEIRSCLTQVEDVLSNFMQKVTEANLLPIINRDSSPGDIQGTYNGIQEAVQELKLFAHYEDAFKYNELVYTIEGLGAYFKGLSLNVGVLPWYIIGKSGDETPIHTDVFSKFFGGRCCAPWVTSGSVADELEGSFGFRNVSDFWIFDNVLNNESERLKDYFYGRIYASGVGDGYFTIFEFNNLTDVESVVQRLYNNVRVDELPVVVDGKEFNMIYWKEGGINNYALITQQDNFLLIINPSTEIKEKNDEVASFLVDTLLTP